MIDTKLLRQKILDLAIRGKLVPQNPSDEPASVLLQKIREEKAALVKAGKVKKDKHESFIFRGDDKHYYEQIDGKTTDITNEIPFDIPDTWEWVRLKNICLKIGSGSTPTGGRQIYVSKGIKFLREQNIYNDGVHWDGITYITEEINGQHKGSQVFAKDILMNITGGSIGRIALVPDNFDIGNINQHILIIRMCNLNTRFYLHRYLCSPYTISLMFDKQTGDKPGLSMEKVSQFLIAVPPLTEQQRIVSQIATLLAEVDKIDADATALDNALTLAKQKILDLAIRGKLVSQDPNDEPASKLLKKIKVEKEALVKAGKIKRDKHESFILRGDDNRYYEQINGNVVDVSTNAPFEIPHNWCWISLGSVADVARGGSPRPIDDYLTNSPDGLNWIKIGDVTTGSKYITETKEKIKPSGLTKTRFVHAGDFLLSNSMSFGRPYILRISGCIHDGWLVLHPNPAVIEQDFLFYALSSSVVYSLLANLASGSTVKNLKSDSVKNLWFPLPPMAEQKRIASAVEQYSSMLAQLE